jgi:hypothetical protein
MTDQDWRSFFLACHTLLSQNFAPDCRIGSRCSWATFDSISTGAHYWSGQLPVEADLEITHIRDGGSWRQPFSYQSLAHVIIPRAYDIESGGAGDYAYQAGEHDLDGLSATLDGLGIGHRKTDLMLEIKLY